jgi:hypothetical protein
MCLLHGLLFDFKPSKSGVGGMSERGQRLSFVAFCWLDAIRGIGRTVHVTCNRRHSTL